MKKIYFLVGALLVTLAGNAQNVLYSNNFESGAGTATIVGNGVIEANATAGFGNVFHNAAGGQGVRTNYLLLPNDIFTNLQTSGSKELSIAFWVNKGTAVNYFFSPLFTAYGAAPDPTTKLNGYPMMALQSRGVTTVNCGGWTDLKSEDNLTGTNIESTVWLDDAKWHYFTATYTETLVKVYVDGVVVNAWNCNGTDGHTVSGLFTNGSELKYICFGGNQAWNWNDPDAAYLLDDLSIYSSALTVEQINANIASKTVATPVGKVIADGDVVGEEYFTVGGGKVGTDYNALTPGMYIKKAVYGNGAVKSEKIVKVQ